MCRCKRIAWLEQVRFFCEQKALASEDDASMWIQSSERLTEEIKNLKEKINGTN